VPDGLDWLDGLAIDGKTVRNSAAPGGIDVKLFSALTHHEQVVIAQITVPEHTTEVTCVPALLDPVDLTNKVVTGDAAHACESTADFLVNIRDTDFTLTVKGNRPHLLEAIAARMPRARTGSAHHTDDHIVGGRRVVREIWVADADGIDFPGARQVFRIRRRTDDLLGRRLSKAVVHGISSLDTARADPTQLLAPVREHWRVEANHWIRDVVYREDHQHAYTGTGAQVMAMIRNLALAVPRLTGHREITRTLQRIAADRTRILPMLEAFPLPTPA
jgi:predicted transposase YbfD/YdcC